MKRKDKIRMTQSPSILMAPGKSATCPLFHFACQHVTGLLISQKRFRHDMAHTTMLVIRTFNICKTNAFSEVPFL